MPVSLSFADEFHAARLNDAWTSIDDDAERSAALLRANDYICAHYDLRPAVTVADERALNTAEALLALEMLSPQSVAATRGIKKLKEAGDGMGSIETEYDDAPRGSDPYPLVTAILAPLIVVAGSPTSGGVYVSRMRS